MVAERVEQKTDARFFSFFSSSNSSRKSIIIVISLTQRFAHSPLPLLLVLEDPKDLRVGLDEGRECVGEDSLHFCFFFSSFF